MSEFDAIRRIAERAGVPPAGQVWIGDDAAVLEHGTLVATDAIVEEVDFRRGDSLADVGWRAIAVNASDIAAMGGRPTAALVTVVGPAEVDLDALYDGVFDACDAFGCHVVGGDLSGGAQLAVSVTMIGSTDGRAPVLRGGATAGERILVTGPLGAAAASGYRTRPVPPVALGPVIARAGATAMIDISDGLAADLGHILDGSGAGAELTTIPVADGATEADALAGGDDYELLFTMPADAAVPDGVIEIGRIVADPTVRPSTAGWQHRFR